MRDEAYFAYGVLLYSALVFLAPLLLRRRYWQSFRWILPITSFFSFQLVNSLSLGEIFLLSRSANDRIGFIKDYYDFRHKNLSSVIKGISSVIILNLGVIIKNHYDKSISPQSYNPDDNILVFLTLILVVINVRQIIKLNDCVREFSLAVKLYETLK